ncbi:hypothetical protein [Halospeciosus flavus]|uniref:Uncharacterized protein n=1 Tax=Halospeciosus flavus TaxID=3032283 RepID=A0ABD5Z293_9EURY|nr:hypothetical protein [Halospeciosus flavus]
MNDANDETEGRYQVLDLQTGEVVGETETRPPLLDAESQELVAGVLHSIVEEMGEDLPDWERAAYERALDELVYEEPAEDSTETT